MLTLWIIDSSYTLNGCRCVAAGCSCTREKDGVSLFQFPKILPEVESGLTKFEGQEQLEAN